jgi:hypothetical protein
VQVLNAEELGELVEELESNKINQYTHILKLFKKMGLCRFGMRRS